MKLGEIKLEALMMIFPGEALNATEDNLAEVLEILKSDPNFSDYLAAMPGAINRCFGVLENKGVLPTMQVDMLLSQGEYRGPWYKYNLRAITTDCGAIERIAFVDHRDGTYCDNCDYRRESEDNILLPFKHEGKYILIYTPRLPRVGLISSESTEILEGRDDIASLIPYFVKSELLYAEHPDDAKLARQLFEEGLHSLVSHKEGHQSKVETVYRTW